DSGSGQWTTRGSWMYGLWKPGIDSGGNPPTPSQNQRTSPESSRKCRFCRAFRPAESIAESGRVGAEPLTPHSPGLRSGPKSGSQELDPESAITSIILVV